MRHGQDVLLWWQEKSRVLRIRYLLCSRRKRVLLLWWGELAWLLCRRKACCMQHCWLLSLLLRWREVLLLPALTTPHAFKIESSVVGRMLTSELSGPNAPQGGYFACCPVRFWQSQLASERAPDPALKARHTWCIWVVTAADGPATMACLKAVMVASSYTCRDPQKSIMVVNRCCTCHNHDGTLA